MNWLKNWPLWLLPNAYLRKLAMRYLITGLGSAGLTPVNFAYNRHGELEHFPYLTLTLPYKNKRHKKFCGWLFRHRYIAYTDAKDCPAEPGTVRVSLLKRGVDLVSSKKSPFSCFSFNKRHTREDAVRAIGDSTCISVEKHEFSFVGARYNVPVDNTANLLIFLQQQCGSLTRTVELLAFCDYYGKLLPSVELLQKALTETDTLGFDYLERMYYHSQFATGTRRCKHCFPRG